MNEYVYELMARLRGSLKSARENLIEAKKKSKVLYDRKLTPLSIKKGQEVFTIKEKDGKFGNKFNGPYKVLEVLDKGNIKIQVERGKEKIIHLNRTKIAHVSDEEEEEIINPIDGDNQIDENLHDEIDAINPMIDKEAPKTRKTSPESITPDKSNQQENHGKNNRSNARPHIEKNKVTEKQQAQKVDKPLVERAPVAHQNFPKAYRGATKKHSGPKINEKLGDILDPNINDALAMYISADLKMEGELKRFKDQFGDLSQLVTTRLQAGAVVGLCTPQRRFIFYLITQDNCDNESTYLQLRQVVTNLHKRCQDAKITKLAIPRLNTRSLSWYSIRLLIESMHLYRRIYNRRLSNIPTKKISSGKSISE